jgi:SAM-dependent methyltransferase
VNQQTVSTLNAINRDFYEKSAEDFSATRQRPWRGWTRLLAHIETKAPKLEVLDIGCGNGRFARFLKEHVSSSFDYVGIDMSKPALEIARRQVSDLPEAQWLEHDIVAVDTGNFLPPEARRPFSLIVAFGLFHHLPGVEQREGLIAELARRLDHQGILAISFWQFARFERFKKKMVPWKEFNKDTGIWVDPSDLEAGDTILTWGGPTPAYRFCHFMEMEEISRLLATQPLEIVTDYHDDGAGRNLNHYFVLEKR